MENHAGEPRGQRVYAFLCPTALQLRQYAWGSLEDRAAHHLFEHLMRCPVCGRKLGAYCSFFALKEAQLSAKESN